MKEIKFSESSESVAEQQKIKEQPATNALERMNALE